MFNKIFMTRLIRLTTFIVNGSGLRRTDYLWETSVVLKLIWVPKTVRVSLHGVSRSRSYRHFNLVQIQSTVSLRDLEGRIFIVIVTPQKKEEKNEQLSDLTKTEIFVSTRLLNINYQSYYVTL